MILLGRLGALFCFLGFASLVVNTEVRAQDPGHAKKHAFAERLARRTSERTERADLATRSAAAARSKLRAPGFSADPVGTPAATPIVPSGYGTGRDGFVESLYRDILGRQIIQSELDYWARVLATGVSPESVAELIWASPEHRRLVQSGKAPGIPLPVAYLRSIAYGNAQKQKQKH